MKVSSGRLCDHRYSFLQSCGGSREFTDLDVAPSQLRDMKSKKFWRSGLAGYCQGSLPILQSAAVLAHVGVGDRDGVQALHDPFPLPELLVDLQRPPVVIQRPFRQPMRPMQAAQAGQRIGQ